MKNLILKNQFCYAIVAALSIVAMTGCSDDNELWDEPEISGPVTIVAQSVDMIEPFSMPEVLSRANDPKNEAEKRINTLHLFSLTITANLLHPMPITSNPIFPM